MPSEKNIIIAIAIFYIVWLFIKALKNRRSNPADKLFPSQPRLGLSPYEVLEVPQHASLEEIHEAYIKKIQFYSNPNHLPSNAKHWQQVAKRKALETQLAYKQLTGQSTPPQDQSFL